MKDQIDLVKLMISVQDLELSSLKHYDNNGYTLSQVIELFEYAKRLEQRIATLESQIIDLQPKPF